MDKKILICSGGTGGHIYPALSLAKDLDKKYLIDILFAGGSLSTNKWFENNQFKYQDISCSTLSLKRGLKNFLSVCKILKGVFESIKLIRKFKPDLVIAFGSFHTFPTLIAACITRKTIYLHEQNKQMGKVNRLFSRWAKKILVSFPKTFPDFKEKSVHVQMPLKFCEKDSLSKSEARKLLNLDPDLKTILVCGGSQGALSINLCFIKSLQHLKDYTFQVIHLIGFNEEVDEIKKSYACAGIQAIVRVFDKKIHVLMQASDFMVSRAGASSVAEMIELKLPAIMIPYPYAKAHQEHNADFVEQIVKGGLKISENSLNDILLAKTIVSFFNDVNIKQYMHHIENYKQATNLASFSDVVYSSLDLYGKK
ncbi:MAG: UDP-N-acetylglucosamine--N-acetylmuramyl-(pentapeptide) pyrophosphoryl-undecaprenol N-acetylglucosamine transferase [Chlamydiae bacterium]|nr:UDP-N-acetylglucosamine--N-acetylmuramyl-(pentapeptide) pyrophosphoryl-undecaprenol N-acetylglucosamine transferase [Chlamydiota bacterium]